MSTTPAQSAESYSVARADFPPLQKVMLQENYEAMQHAHHSVSAWKKYNAFLVIPALALVAFYTIPQEVEHLHHLSEHPNTFQAYPYMRKRKNPYAWGDDNLFYNPNANPRPE
ncbi:cytochrome c oxidase subunit VIa-domain-containing protein [Gaertneriomyces semiglobifer]|nr:cytochrome c oxidase subunit VIa-domain-containing protein [Gaertneriomyces semiglobifer]